jgi:hypothetical protein
MKPRATRSVCDVGWPVSDSADPRGLPAAYGTTCWIGIAEDLHLIGPGYERISGGEAPGRLWSAGLRPPRRSVRARGRSQPPMIAVPPHPAAFAC